MILGATSRGSGLEVALDFLGGGGVFMFFIGGCSLVGVAVVIYKLLSLAEKRIVPKHIEEVIEGEGGLVDKFERVDMVEVFEEGESVLARLCGEVSANKKKSLGELQELVQNKAREEIVAMGSGLAGLDVVVTIAPLLGLLGTASGLVMVFADFGVVQEGAQVKMAQGIAMALNTTIAGLAVAVPAVVAHTYFARRVEKFSARLEVLMGRVVRSVFEKDGAK